MMASIVKAAGPAAAVRVPRLAARIQWASLDAKLPTLERATQATGSDKAQAEVALYQVRKHVFDLKC